MVLIVPLSEIAKGQAEAVKGRADSISEDFSQEARSKGYITKKMYEEYLSELGMLGDTRHVNLQLSHPVTGKESAERNNNEDIPKLSVEYTSWKGGSELQTKQLATTHTHTDDCYSGHRHTSTCKVYMGDTLAPLSLYEDYSWTYVSDATAYHRNISTNYTVKCDRCGNTLFQERYGGLLFDDWSGYNWGRSGFTYTYTTINQSGQRQQVSKVGRNAGIINYNSTYHNDIYANYYTLRSIFSSGLNLKSHIDHGAFGYNKIFTYNKSAYYILDDFGSTNTDMFNGLIYGTATVSNLGCPYCAIVPTYICGQTEDSSLDCGNVVLSLTASQPTQTVWKGDPIITTAIATLLDGTTKTINCNVTGYDSNFLGTQTVTLNYSGLVNNTRTNGAKTCTTTVTVKSRKTLSDITVSPATQEIHKYTDPLFSVIASYSDGTSNQVLGFSISRFDNTIIGVQTVTISYTEDGIQKTAIASVTVQRLTRTCPVCGTVYELNDYDVDQGCPTCSGTIVSISASMEEVTVGKGEELPITVTATYRDGKTGILSGWVSNYNSNQIGLQDVKITYDTFTAHVLVTVSDNKICPVCGNIYSLISDGTDPGCPICAAEVVSIAAFPKNITIERNVTLPITVTATYKDGHTNIITGWGTDFMADKSGEYEVPIYYKTAVDYIYVTVLDEGMITCPYCHVQYSHSDNPNGCPICSKQIVGIEAQLRYGGNQVLYRSDLSLQVILIYRDTHRKITYTGFEYSGFDSSLLGLQMVTVTYGEFSTTLTVEVINNQFLVTCPICGSQYYLNEDGSNPGCPYCNRNIGDNAVFYFDCIYTMDILDTLYEQGIYYLTEGDYFTVNVMTVRDSVISRLANLFRFRKQEDFKKENNSFGGKVRMI